MIEEIIYTSAQKGLKAGSRGFCTVVSTAGMALNTAERLESMSGYRHAFPMQDPRAQHNPVNFSHVTLRIGGKNAHVISRVSDAGQDYSGRTNKLAHHLMLDDVSRFVAGPARLMVENGVLVTQWDGNIHNVPPRNLPVPALPKLVELKAWKAATGDSGWSGWVAEQLMKDKAPVSVIFSAGTDTLTLVREALDLLPPIQRWEVTFSTYFTKLLAGTECQLRFVLDDTPEATALRNDARAKVVDLTKSLSAAAGGAIVAQARTGRVQLENSDFPEQRIPNRSQPQVQADPLREVVPVPARNEERLGSGTSPEIPMLSPRAPAIPFVSRSGPPDLFDKPIRKSGRRTLVLYAVGSLLLMVLASGVTFFVVTKMNGTPRRPVETPVAKSNDGQIAIPESRFNVAEGPNNGRNSDNRGTDTGTTPPSTPSTSNSAVEETSSPIANAVPDAPSILQTQQPMADSSSPSPSEPDFKPVVQTTPPDPFALVLKDPNFKYPQHELLLFKLPDSAESAGKCNIPLILQAGDKVSLALHAGFAGLIDGRSKGGAEGFDFRLTRQSSPTEWKAECYQDGNRFDSFGSYKLRPRMPNELGAFMNATDIIEFTAENFLTDGREKDIPNLFRMNPLVVCVTSQTGTAVSKVFCQSNRQSHPAEPMNGRWKPEFSNESNALRRLAILNGRADSPQKMYFEIVTLSHECKRIVRRFSFPKGKMNEAKGTLFSNIAVVAQKESDFHANQPDADGESGYIQHDFSWQFEKENEATPNVAHQYSVTKDFEAVLCLPAMPDSKSEKQILPEHSFATSLIAFDAAAFDNTACCDSLDLVKHPELRLRTNSRKDDKFADNSERLIQKTGQIRASLDTAQKEKEKGLKDLEAAWKDKPKTKEIEEQFKRFNSDISEIKVRITKLEELLKRFSGEEHEKQFKAFKASQESEKDRVIGYEIAVDLEQNEKDGIQHPATTIYLIETVFKDEQQ